MQRAVPLPIEPADIAALDARGDKIFYQTTPPQMIEGPLLARNLRFTSMT